MKRLLATELAFTCIALSISASAQCLHYMGNPVTLTGMLTLQSFYGPPGYGENPRTDDREGQAILLLTKPICVSANTSDEDAAEQNQKKVTLVSLHGEDLRAFVGQRISVTGTLFHANTAHHHTHVLIEVGSVQRQEK